MKMLLPMKIGLSSLATLVTGSLFGFVAFPSILRSQITKQMSLKQGTDIRDMWIKVPFPLDFKIYIFNCTNHMEVMKGALPIVKEVGPYHYDEWKEKVNVEDIEDEDAIYYNRRDTFFFNKEKSGPGLTGHETIIMPHVIIISTGITVATEKPSMMSLVGKAINALYGNPQSVFVTVKAKDILFDGIIIDCDTTDFAPKAVCSVMKKSKTFKNLGNGKLSFSLFGLKNGTIEEPKFKVLRGIRDIMDVGKVVEFNGTTSQQMWMGPACNDFAGTDSTVFPPFLTEQDDLLSFTPDICRSLGAWYTEKSSYDGVPANRYVAHLGDLSADPRTQCFCDGPGQCPPAGLMDIKRCVGGPVVVSMPHFLHAAPDVQGAVRGLAPNVKDHEIYIDFEPISGTPLQARKRLQFNIPLTKIEKLDLFKELPGVVMPMFWVEEGLALNKTFMKMLDHQLFLPMRMVNILKWMMVWGGAAGVVSASILHFMPAIMKFALKTSSEVQPIRQANGQTNSPANGQINTITLSHLNKVNTMPSIDSIQK